MDQFRHFTAEEVLAELMAHSDEFKLEAVRQVSHYREFLTPPLLAELTRHVRKIENNPFAQWQPEDYPSTNALYVLAEFREPRALPLLISLCRLPEDLSEAWLGDMLLEDFPSLLASTCPQDPAPLLELAADPAVYIYARWAALNALILLAHEKLMSRGDLIDWVLRQCETEPRVVDNDFWAMLLPSVAHDLAAPELLPVLRESFAQGLTTEEFERFEDLEKSCHRPVAMAAEDFGQHHHLVKSAFDEMILNLLNADNEDDWEDDLDGGDVVTPFVRAQPKTGRNDPCPCGSGKKYKKCCL